MVTLSQKKDIKIPSHGAAWDTEACADATSFLMSQSLWS